MKHPSFLLIAPTSISPDEGDSDGYVSKWRGTKESTKNTWHETKPVDNWTMAAWMAGSQSNGSMFAWKVFAGPWFVPGQQLESDQQGGILLRRQSQCHAHHSHVGSSSSNIRRRSSKRRMCLNVVELRCCTYLEIQDLFLQIDVCMKTTHPCCRWLFCASRYGIFVVQAEIRCIVRINFYTLRSSWQHNKNVQIPSLNGLSSQKVLLPSISRHISFLDLHG